MDFKEIESFLTDIKSVISCKIIANENNNITEIHILSDISRHTKQIARDIRSALISEYNLDVDYKVISVAQIMKNLSTNTDFRFIYDGYTNEITQDRIKICSKLFYDDNEYIGMAEGIKSEKNMLKVAAASTLDAVQKAIGMDCFVIEDIQPSKLAGQEVILTAITYIDKGGESVLTGSSVVTNNKIDSTIKSTLNAINRKLCLFYKD